MRVNVRILKLLDEDDRNLSWLAKHTKLNYSNLHKLANNETTSISFNNLIKLCSVLNCDIGDILEIVECE